MSIRRRSALIGSVSFTAIAQGALVDALPFSIRDTLPGSPAFGLGAVKPMAWFGQTSADKLAGDSADGTRRLTLPANALARPSATQDWYVVLRATTGQKLTLANYEILASNGAGNASGSSSGAVGIYDRGTTTPAGMNWRWQVAINNPNSRDLFAGISPALTTQPRVELGAEYCIVFGVSNGRRVIGIQRHGSSTAHYLGGLDNTGTFDGYYFPAAQYSDGTVERANGVLTYRKASIAGAYAAGVVVLIRSTSRPEINGVYPISTRLASNAGFTVACPGADFGVSAADAQVAIMRSSYNIFDTIGGLKTAVTGDNYGWGGSVGGIQLRIGSLPLSGGLVDTAWLDSLTHRRIADASMPGTKQYRSLLSPADGYAADADGTVTGAATATGTPRRAPASPDWVNIDPWDWHTPFAADLNSAGGTSTGTVRIGFTSAYTTGPLYASVEDANGNTVVAEQKVSNGCAAGQRGKIVAPNVPVGMDYYLRLRAKKTGFTTLWGPFSVGPTFAWISQSTINVLFQTTSGTLLAPVSDTSGIATIGDVAGPLASALTDAGSNYTNQAGWCRPSTYPVEAAGSASNGILGFTNKLIELHNAQLGRRVPVGAWNLCRSGHPCDIYWSDRKTYTTVIGTVAPGGTLTGNWTPHPLWASSVTWTKVGSVKIYRGSTLVATVNGSNTLVAEGGSGVSGTFDHGGTAAYSITDPVGGQLSIEAEMFFDTATASTGGARTGTGFTVWGVDGQYDTGHISNVLTRMPRQTAFVYSWANYLLSWAGARTQAQVDEKVAFDIATLRQRIETNYPEHAGTPWIIACDARTKSTSSIGEHRIRKAMRKYALETPNTHWSIGPITGDMDAVLNSPHPGTLASSGQLWGITFAHGVAAVCGIAGAKAAEVYPVSGTRSGDGTYVDLVFNVPAGAALTCADPTKIEGLYFGTSNDDAALSLVDVAGGTHTTQIIGSNAVRVTKASGTFPATTYWNCHIGFVLTDAVFATENTRLANTLSLNSGGYNDIRPGQPITFAPTNVTVQ